MIPPVRGVDEPLAHGNAYRSDVIGVDDSPVGVHVPDMTDTRVPHRDQTSRESVPSVERRLTNTSEDGTVVLELGQIASFPARAGHGTRGDLPTVNVTVECVDRATVKVACDD